jgi:hypothetical protein
MRAIKLDHYSPDAQPPSNNLIVVDLDLTVDDTRMQLDAFPDLPSTAFLARWILGRAR